MPDDISPLIKSLAADLPSLTGGQLRWLQRAVSVLLAEHAFALVRTDLLDAGTLQDFGDAIRLHHSFSAEPFRKEKFEYAFVKVFAMRGHGASLAPKGNPGYDVMLDGVRFSLKTQADAGVQEDFLWISKFMELGKGKWGDQAEDLGRLRDQFLAHLEKYDRILTLRTLHKQPLWKYELVEIPKDLLARASAGTLAMQMESKQDPKPGYCYVREDNGLSLFDLYFDAGGERKLQIKNLRKAACTVHATWEFAIPPE